MNKQDIPKYLDFFCTNEISLEELKRLFLELIFTKELSKNEKKPIGIIFKTAAGGTPSRFKNEYWDGDINWLASGELKDRIVLSSREKITKIGLDNSSTKLFPKDTSLIAITGATTGETALLGIESCTNQSVIGIYPHADYYPKFIWYFLMSKYSYFRNLTLGSAQPHINKGIIDESDFPITSKTQQKNIIDKVERFFYRINEYKPFINQKKNVHKTLIETIFNNLIDLNNNEQSIKTWNSIRNNFCELISDADDVKQIRKLFLSFAVSGKLVPQDPKDEPASELLKKIKTEKEKLIKEGKIRKNKPLPPISDEEIPYELPKGWEWTRVNNISIIVTDGEHNTPPLNNKGIPLLKAKNVRDGYIDYSTEDYVDLEIAKKSWKRCNPQNNDLLMVCVGATTGRVCRLENINPFVLVRSVALIRPSRYINSKYLEYFFESNLCQNQIWSQIKQTAQPHFYLYGIEKIVFTLPPLFEQKRIVEKVDQLMKLCDELESKVKENQKNSELLMEAVLREAFEV